MEEPVHILTLTEDQGRPYRSHLKPACIPCRKRKTRCQTSTTINKCITCHLRRIDCVFPQAGVTTLPEKRGKLAPVTATTKASSIWQEAIQQHALPETVQLQRGTVKSSEAVTRDVTQCEAVSGPLTMLTESAIDSDHVVGPMTVDDADELENYLTSSPAKMHKRVKKTSEMRVPGYTARPILFTTVPKRPLGVSSNQSESAKRCVVIERILEPHVEDLVDLFLEDANVCFPIFDAPSFKKSYAENKDKISPALIANLYANALIYWNDSPKLRLKHCPDARFIWNQANEALHSELFLSPGISTVIAIVLNVCGRPSTSIFGNGGMVGTAVALSNALGLNRDPTDWDIPVIEKSFRIRLWWLVVLHDRWCSLAYGTPLQINCDQHDVPLPTNDDFQISRSSHTSRAAASIFISLASLTKVLGKYLEHIYRISKEGSAGKEITHTDMEAMLHMWEESLNDEARRIVVYGTELSAPGAANFRLAYLAVKLLLRRIQLNSCDPKSPTTNVMPEAFTQAQRAAEEIVYFVKELDENHLRGFWLPVNAFSLTSATTFILRSSVKPDNMMKAVSLDTAKEMITTLDKYRKSYNWDLADHCILNCSDMVAKIESSIQDEMPMLPDFQDFLQMDGSILDEMFMGFNYESDNFLR